MTKIMTRGYELDSFGMPKPTPAAEYQYLGDFSATPPWHSRGMQCDNCRVTWTGCWDNFECPKCGQGELPGPVLTDSMRQFWGMK